MESKETEKGELEKLAEMRAKRRLDSWSERFKSIWFILLVLLSVIGFFALLILWIGVLGGGIKTTLGVFVTVGIFILGGVFYDQNKTWKKARLRELYEEELLELKMKSKGKSKRDEASLRDTSPEVAAPPKEEKMEFNVILNNMGANKINVIKVVRELTSLGLKESKDLVESAPKAVRGGVNKDEATSIKQKLEAAGATVEIK